MHADALRGGTRALIHDDVLATGGTAKAKADLVEQLGGQVAGCAFVVELAFLTGRETLAGYDVHALVSYRPACSKAGAAGCPMVTRRAPAGITPA